MLAEETIIAVLKGEFPGHREDYYSLLVSGFLALSDINWSLDREQTRDATRWHLLQDVFYEPLRYYQTVLMRWPATMLAYLDQNAGNAKSFEQYIRMYMSTHFSAFLCNTKMLTVAHPLIDEWNECYEEWVEGSARQIEPIVGLNEDRTNELVRPIVNEVIVNPRKYEEDYKQFEKLVKRQYRLLLAENDN